MKLTLNSKYKSLEPFSIDLPDFTILTGVNGAGKTQILNSIIENHLKLQDNELDLAHIKYVTHATLSPNDSSPGTRQSIRQVVDSSWNQYKSFIERFKQPINNLDHLPPNHPRRLRGEHTHQPTFQQIVNNPRYLKLIDKIAAIAKKDFNELTVNDFHKFYPIEDGLNPQDVFSQNLSSLFKKYHDRKRENKLNKFLKEVEGENDSDFLSEEEFIQVYGEPPWELVNKIISEAKLDYYLTSPASLHPDAPFDLKLINKYNSAEVKFSDLSSGEKVIMSLALALYNSNFEIEFPKVLLMDEPDASLHPSMCKQFLEVIEHVFVKEKGVKVIITTHSPSTVALAPEESLYVVNKTGNRIGKTTKDTALKILTSGVPSFSVNYENRRQVFVESPNDVAYYERIYQILSRYLIPEVSLSFISSGESRTDKNGTRISNCSQVENIVEILRTAGNNLIWGIIDWDSKNSGSEFVVVLGKEKRYSIENYILDPLLISALLLREKIISRGDLGLVNNETYTDFRNLNQSQLQYISNFLVSKVGSFVNSPDTSIIKTKLINEIEIEVPKWFLNYHGHSLEALIIRVFPELNAIKKGKEEALKLEIINKVMDDLPELISNDFLDAFNNVQKLD